MSPEHVQVIFFQQLKAKLPPHLSMVDEVADLLNISTDSAYRRIRGEKPIDLEEAQKLCRQYNLSLDKLMHLKTDSILFTGNVHLTSDHAFEEWLANLVSSLQQMNAFQKKHIYFLIKDIPPFLYFQVPELAAFKFFLWMKSILHYESYRGVKFRIDDPRYADYLAASKKVIELYNKIPTTEIWNVESINSTLRQINFIHEAGSFEKEEEVRILYNRLFDLINHIEKEAEAGGKCMFGCQPSSGDPEYRLFVNELILGDNTFLAELDQMRVTYLNHSVLFYVGTHDEEFNKAMFMNLDNLIKKSTLISSVGEKERNRFFNGMREKIAHQEQLLR